MLERSNVAEQIPLIPVGSICRPKALLTEFGKRFPQLWKDVDEARNQDRKRTNLPDWCFTTSGCSAQVICKIYGLDRQSGQCPSSLIPISVATHFLSSWRATQGIYRIDEAIYSDLINTVELGAVPCDVLFHMPEWCVYVETPNLISEGGGNLHGFFALLEPDYLTGEPKLSFFLDCEQVYDFHNVHLRKGASLIQCIAETYGIM